MHFWSDVALIGRHGGHKVHTVRAVASYFDYSAVWVDDPMEVAFEGCYFLGNPGGAAGGVGTPYADKECAGGGEEHCYQSTCCSHPKQSTDPPNCMMCNGAFITLSSTKNGHSISKGEVFGFSVTNSFFDWGGPWYSNTSNGRRAIAINETNETAFDRSLITNSRVAGNSFTGIQGSSTRLRKSLRLENAKLWTFDFCTELLFPPVSTRNYGAPLASAAAMFPFVGYSIQIEDADVFVQHKLAPANESNGCKVEVMTDKPVSAIVYVEVDQSKESLQYIPKVPA